MLFNSMLSAIIYFIHKCIYIITLQVETITFGFLIFIVRQYRYQLALEFFIWCFALFIFLIIGSYIPVCIAENIKIYLFSFFFHQHDLTVDIVVIILIGVISFFGATYFLMVYLIINLPYSFFIFRALMVFSILPVS